MRWPAAVLISISGIIATALLRASLPSDGTAAEGFPRGEEEALAVYRLLGPEPPLGASVALARDGTASIDKAHGLGLPHGAVWVLVVDARSRALMLRRSPDARTCPSAWMFVGEHQRAGEGARACAARAVVEELGGGGGVAAAWWASRAALDGSLVNLTATPRFERHDWPDGRVDREVSSTLALLLRDEARGVPLALDGDAREHRWVELDELERWLADAPADFCDEAVRVFTRLGVASLRRVLEARRPSAADIK